MSDFERIYQTDPSMELKHGYEKHPSIELSDIDFLRKIGALPEAELVYKPPIEEEMTPALKEKFEKAKKITQETKVIDIRGKNERKKSKASEKRAKKANSKSNKPAVARV